MAALYSQFQALNADVLAISTDSIYAHKVFAEVSPSARKVQYPLISDRSQMISRRYGVLREGEGFTHRGTYILSPGGTIRFTCLYPYEMGRNVKELLRLIQGLQYADKTGLAVPPGWEPGLPGLNRDFSMVGRI